MRVTERCEACSAKLGDLAILFLRKEIDREEWLRRGFGGVQRHHTDWPTAQVWGYVRSRAPFYPFGDPAQHPHPAETA